MSFKVVVVVPFLNEGEHLPTFLASMDAQTRRPDRLMLVDDGSTDASSAIAARFAAARPWVTYANRPQRPAEDDRLATAAELLAFKWGVTELTEADRDWDVIVKMDGDLELSPVHFAQVVRTLETDPSVGTAGAYLSYRDAAGQTVREPHPAEHVRGPTKFYRRACFEAISPLPEFLGWDGIDDIKARALGWRTRSVELEGGDSIHLRPTGMQDGALRANRRWGLCAYAYGAHPFFALAVGASRVRRRPVGLAAINYVFGYAAAALRRAPRAEPLVITQARREERARVRTWLSSRLRRGARARSAVVFAGSAGGHLNLLWGLRHVVGGSPAAWVVQTSERGARLERDVDEEVVMLPEWGRGRADLPRALQNVARSAAAAARLRPRLVVTSGAGAVVPFCVFARLLGARLIFIETTARVDTSSKSGAALSRLAQETLVQWEPMGSVYPGSIVCLPVLLEDIGVAEHEGNGTVVTVGTHDQPFDRLLEMVDAAAGSGLLPQPLLVQAGVSRYEARHFDPVPWMDPGELDRAVATSRFVVAHGGSGAIALALRHGRRPLVLARRRAEGEHFDDHQVRMVGEVARADYAVELDGSIKATHLHAAARALPAGTHERPDRPTVAAALRAAIDRQVAERER